MTEPNALFDPAAHGWEKLEEPGYPARMGGFWRKTEGDAVLFGLLADAGHLNRNGSIHGGAVLGLADHALGHTSVHAGQGRKQATVQLDVQFVAAPLEGDFMVARGEVVRMTRSIIFMRAEIMVGQRLVATANGIWKILGA
jgi:uncharacterized protein (TIGR00369 family)